MKTNLVVVFVGLLAQGAALAVDVALPADQIASAVLAAPKERRNDATVLGYNAKVEVVTLRKGTNDLVCLASNPKDQSFSVACYHKNLEPLMARSRELAAFVVDDKDVHQSPAKDAEHGNVPVAREASMLYVVRG